MSTTDDLLKTVQIYLGTPAKDKSITCKLLPHHVQGRASEICRIISCTKCPFNSNPTVQKDTPRVLERFIKNDNKK